MKRPIATKSNCFTLRICLRNDSAHLIRSLSAAVVAVDVLSSFFDPVVVGVVVVGTIASITGIAKEG